mgnify:CR=1 FL=1
MEQTLEQTLGEKLGELRQKQGLTQQQVAERLEVTAAAVSTYERDANLPSLPVLKKLAGLYGVSLDYLMDMEPACNAELRHRQELLVGRLEEIIGELTQWIEDGKR